MTTASATIPPPAATAVGGVVVTYHPDAEFATRLRAIADEVGPLFVIDNSADAAVAARLARTCSEAGATFFAQGENTGLAAALNRGFHQLLATGVPWGIAFDQDSTPRPGFTRALLATAKTDAAVTGANWRDEAHPDRAARHLMAHRIPFLFRRREATTDLDDVTCVIASGSLFHLPTWRDLGGFDESLFLDLVDSDYCLRARAAGYPIRVASRAHLDHRRGAKREVRWAGQTCWPAFMPPARLYYLFRNRVPLLPRELWRAPHWVTFELAYAGKALAEIVLLEDRTGAKLAACGRGLRDGLLGGQGPARWRLPS